MVNWQPNASLTTLQQRAMILQKIRTFFAARAVLEVETPLLSHATITSPNIHSFVTRYSLPGSHKEQQLYLQTSPEFAMKRLLAAGSGPIYQICKAFRNQGESGQWHNPEFTMLEWYRPGFDHHALMTEVDAFFQTIVACEPAQKISYAEIFQKTLHFNPHTVSLDELIQCAAQQGLQDVQWSPPPTRDDWLQLLMAHCIEPSLGRDRPVFVYDFPSTQAALARLSQDKLPIAQRFEVYWKGVELANGFYELGDAAEQRARFAAELAQREQQQQDLVPLDERLLAALAAGFPDCAGVAVGIDRLIMLALDLANISSVLSFTIERA